MGAWDLFVGLLGPVAVGLLLIVLGWAASERGQSAPPPAHVGASRASMRPPRTIGSRSSTESLRRRT